MRGLDFIHSGARFQLLVAEKVEDILPRLRAAAPPPAGAEERKAEAQTVQRM
jgi:hypothetical protein